MPGTQTGPWLWTNALADNDGLNPANYSRDGGATASSMFGPGDPVQWSLHTVGGTTADIPFFATAITCLDATISHYLSACSNLGSSGAGFANLTIAGDLDYVPTSDGTNVNWYLTDAPSVGGNVRVEIAAESLTGGNENVMGFFLANAQTVGGSAYLSGGSWDGSIGQYPVICARGTDHATITGDVQVDGAVGWVVRTAIGGTFIHTGAPLVLVLLQDCAASTALQDAVLAAAADGAAINGKINVSYNGAYPTGWDNELQTWAEGSVGAALVAAGWSIYFEATWG